MKNRKSIAWPLTYRSPEKTLETAEVNAAPPAHPHRAGEDLACDNEAVSSVGLSVGHLWKPPFPRQFID
ncbi:MAG: hypothetical protein IPK32_12605 [Verrucomicrobiaceae bacterium]|nr:hypothetical protein [Verrucomicrobiaceae bacterium]